MKKLEPYFKLAPGAKMARKHRPAWARFGANKWDSNKSVWWRMQNGRCFYCDEPFERAQGSAHGPMLASWEHLLPESEGGTWDPFNVVLAHQRCNQLRDRMSVDEYMALLGQPQNKFRWY